jgi:hypothetical protein
MGSAARWYDRQRARQPQRSGGARQRRSSRWSGRRTRATSSSADTSLLAATPDASSSQAVRAGVAVHGDQMLRTRLAER